MPWFELSVEVTGEAVDWVTMTIATIGIPSDRLTITQMTEPEDAAPEGERGWEYTFRLYVAPDESVNAVAANLEQALGSLQRAHLVSDIYVQEVAQKPATPDGTGTYPQRVGQHFVVLAPGQQVDGAPNDHVLRLAATQAFGTGLHPATQLSLRLLERQPVEGMYALDLGSGSGILSVALARMGARVLALDNDPIAVQATGETVTLNGLDQQITVAAGSLGLGADLGHWMGWTNATTSERIEDQHVFDLVVANLFARIHIAVAPDYRRALKPGGILITAGFTVDREDEVSARLEDVGFKPLDRLEAGEWIALAHRSSLVVKE